VIPPLRSIAESDKLVLTVAATMPSSTVLRGFILQPTYRVESGRPVVHLYGRLEDGRTFLVRDHRLVPHFYVEKSEAGRARELGARWQVPTARITLDGRAVVRIEVPTPADTPPLRDRLTKAGIPTYEADVRFAMRYLIDHRIRGALEIRGEGRPVPGVGVVLEDPELAPADWTPRLAALSMDVETFGAPAAGDLPPRLWRLGGAAPHAFVLELPRGGTCLPHRAGSPGRPLRARA